MFRTIKDVNVSGKKVLVRVDFNVPLDENLKITDDTRMRMAVPTLKHIIDNGGRAKRVVFHEQVLLEKDRSRDRHESCRIGSIDLIIRSNHHNHLL